MIGLMRIVVRERKRNREQGERERQIEREIGEQEKNKRDSKEGKDRKQKRYIIGSIICII